MPPLYSCRDPVAAPVLLPFFSNYCIMALFHSFTVSSETPEENLFPSTQFPVPATSFTSFPLSPKPELADVQNGTTVFPVKSFTSTNPFTGHASIPHPMGIPLKSFQTNRFAPLCTTSNIHLLISRFIYNCSNR